MLTDAQREARRKGLGGSDAAAICGRHPSKSPVDVWKSKVYGIDGDAGERAAWGNRLEAIVREAAAERLDIPIREVPDTLVHRTRPFMLANLDGECADGAIYEGKCLDARQIARLGPKGSEQPLLEHWYQVQHYLDVADRDLARVAYLIGGNDLRIYEVARNREFGATLAHIEGEWWERHVVRGEVPADEDPEKIAEALGLKFPRHGEGLIRTEAIAVIDVARRYVAASAAEKQAKAAKVAVGNELRALIGTDAGFDFGPEIGKATWKAKTQPSLDAKALRAAHPEIARKFTRATPVRALSVRLKGLDAGDDE
jgi:putative phage-type endonuclease